MKKITIITLLIIIYFPVYGFKKHQSMILEYTEKKDNSVQVHSFNIKDVDGVVHISLKTTEQGNVIEQTFTMTNWMDTDLWTYRDNKENTRIMGRKKLGEIFLTGIHKGKKIEKSFKLGFLKWNQLFHIGLKDFILGSTDTIKFFAVGTTGIGDMKGTRFKAEKQGEQRIVTDGKQINTIYINISMTGFKSVFWNGHYWFERNNGIFMRYSNKSDFSRASNQIIRTR